MADEGRKKIMVIDDEEDVRVFLKTLFEDYNYETCVAEDGDVAYKMLPDEKPDLITLDLDMPHETGTRFYRQLSKNPDFKDTPVIIISGLAGRHLAVKEPVSVFDKPVDQKELMQKVEETIGQSQ
mgnify:CR=1 FL=1